jgi:hypothetical protein
MFVDFLALRNEIWFLEETKNKYAMLRITRNSIC